MVLTTKFQIALKGMVINALCTSLAMVRELTSNIFMCMLLGVLIFVSL